MYRVTSMTPTTIDAVEIEDDFQDVKEGEIRNIQYFADAGFPVVICNKLADAAELYGVDVGDIRLMEKNDF